MKEKETLILPIISSDKKSIEEALKRLCTKQNFKLDIIFLGHIQDYLRNQDTSLSLLCECLVESQIYHAPQFMNNLHIGFSYPEHALPVGTTAPFKIKNKDGKETTFNFNTISLSESCWGEDVVIPEEAKASFALPTITPYMHCGKNRVNLSNYSNEHLLNAAYYSESALDCLSKKSGGIIDKASKTIPYFKTITRSDFNPEWKLRFTDKGYTPTDSDNVGGDNEPEKTKHWVYFTGGTDSTLIVSTILRLMEKQDQDELVIVLVKHSNMGSGQAKRIEAALSYLAANLIDLNLAESILKRVSIVAPANETIGSANLQSKGINVSKGDQVVSLPLLEIDTKDQVMLKTGVSIQESLVLASAALLVPYLGKCKNTFYIGLCSSDSSIPSVSHLCDYFSETFAIIGQANSDIKKEWLPTLEVPLERMRKSDIIYNLEVLGCRNFAVDKSEDLLMHYAMNDPQHLANERMFSKNDSDTDKGSLEHLMKSLLAVNKQNGGEHEITGKLKAYHSVYLTLGYPEEFTSFSEYAVTGKLEYKKDNEVHVVPESLIEPLREGDAQKQALRKLGLSYTMDTDLNFE